MKLKKTALLLAATLCATTLAACGEDKKIVFYDYWKNHSESSNPVDETLTYSVSFEKGAGLDNVNYELSYENGIYTAHLKTDGEGYLYTTKLNLSVTYTYGEKSETFQDSVETEVRFKSAINAPLTPTSSKKTVVSHTPASGNVSNFENSYVAYDYTIETVYGETPTSTVTYRETEDIAASFFSSTFTTDSEEYSYLDNEQILLALRAVQSSTTSGTVISYNPFLKATQQVNFSFQTAENDTFTYTLNGEEKTDTISCRNVNLVLDEINPGATQTAKIAVVTNNTNNQHRNIMLSLETPLSYSFGSLVYKLKTIERA